MFYVLPIVTTEKIPIEYTQKKMRMESKHVTLKKKRTTNEIGRQQEKKRWTK